MARNTLSLTVVVTPQADRDLDAIWNYNTQRYDADHADNYAEFLETQTQQLATKYLRGRCIPSHLDIRTLTIQQGRGAGYYAVYRIKGETVEVARYLHTARDIHGMVTRGEV